MRIKEKMNRIISGVLAAGTLFGTMPIISYAAQSNEYVDPADVWMEANGRTNEFDMNATTTYETQYCPVCNMETTSLTYRVPEYTRSGETALNRGVQFSDGTMIDGVSKGNVDSGTPGVDAFYTGYHFTKSVCQICGTINAIDGQESYSFGRNVYSLNPCDANFFQDFDNTSYETYNDEYHTTILKAGKYCQFCKGTHSRAEEQLDEHNIDEIVDGELGNQRFHITGECADCGYTKNNYAAAKSVVQSYYGPVDGKAHSVTLSDLSDAGVKTSIRYGTTADNCKLTSAPNYTEAGYYPVYYQIDYSYGDETMTENGVSYVWLLAATDSSDSNTNSSDNDVHVHDYRYLESIAPSCTALGYDRFQCSECGSLMKTNYTPATGHDYDTIVVREPSCQQGGLELHICKKCGEHYTESTSKTSHSYTSNTVAATCTMNGYTEHTCIDCGHRYITDLTPLAKHDYREKVTAPTCTTKGFTTYTCADCGDVYIGDEKESIAHSYTSTVTEPTCTEMGFTTNVCDDCGYTYISDYTDPLGHDHVETVTAPTCTEIGYSTFTCSRCGDSYIGNETAKLPHDYDKAVTEPTCTEMGYTVFTCKDCGDTYTGDYTDANGHSYKEEVTAPTCTELGYSTFTCEVCGHSYKGNETSTTEHNYSEVVTAPTCTELGYTTITCDNCGDTHKINYVEAVGHKKSEWIIDVPATIEKAGSKHVECTVCGTTLETAEIAQLPEHDNSDEDGNSMVGDYSVLITDENGKPIFNSEISIDTNDNLTIVLPDGRLLSAEDITTITVIHKDSQQPAEGLNIFIADTSDNAATGRTDANGQLSVPNKQSSTGKSNGTVADENNTFVVVVTDKDGQLITDCDVTIGENYSINVKLPNGTAFNKDNRITTTVVTEKGKPVSGLRVQMIGDGDFVENGYTNIRGQVTMPMSNSDVTDSNGNAETGEIIGENIYDYIVTVSDEQGFIPDALITMIAEDNSILVCLPEGKTIDYYNRTTVKVVRSDGTAVEGWKVSVYHKDGSGLRTEVTDEDGIVIVPPLSEAPIAKPRACEKKSVNLKPSVVKYN